MRATIRHHNGAPALFIDGRPHSAFSYMTYAPDARWFEQFGRAGVPLQSLPVSADRLQLWGMREVWTARDTVDHSQTDEWIEMVVDVVPDALLFPRVHTIAPQWWVDEHPDDLVPGEWLGYRYPSWASESGLQVQCDAITRCLDHMRTQPYAEHIIGTHVCSWAVGEWMGISVDTSRPMVERFRGWLDERYGTSEKLRDAWSADVSIETAGAPDDAFGDGVTTMSSEHVADWWRHYTDCVSSALLRLAHAAKLAWPDRLVGAFYGYLLQFGPLAAFHGHAGLAKVLRSPDVDFLSSPSCYHRRSLHDGASFPMGPAASVKLHGKMWWNENDYRTVLIERDGTWQAGAEAAVSPEDQERMRGMARQVGYTDSIRDSIQHQIREAAMTICDAGGQWWFDMGGGWFDDDELRGACAQLARTALRATDFDRTSLAQIVVVIDEDVLQSALPMSNLLRDMVLDQFPAVCRVGAPFDVLLASDVADARPYRLWIHLGGNASRDDAGLQVYVGGEAPGMRTVTHEEAVVPSVTITEPAHPLTRGLAGLTFGLASATADQARHSRFTAAPPPDATRRAQAAGVRYATDGTVLGWLADPPQPGLAAKGNTVFASCGPLPSPLVRAFARAAGVHLYLDTDDVVYANASFVSVTSSSEGQRRLRLPAPSDVVDTMTGAVLAKNSDEITLDMEADAAMLLFTGDATAW